jgi:cob(I)alamin adenosyltransferase
LLRSKVNVLITWGIAKNSTVKHPKWRHIRFMVTLNRIYTGTGDDGSTGQVGGERIGKDSPKVSAYGDVDELNSHLGLIRELSQNSSKQLFENILITIQNELFDIGCELATPADAHWEGMAKATQEHISRLEGWIDDINGPLPPLKSFILPGGSVLAAQIHIARTVCRRAERSIITLSRIEPVSPFIIKYVNRLSDLLFVAARAVTNQDGREEFLWAPGSLRPTVSSTGRA